jgi:CRISPR-associated protein Cas1
MLTDLDALPAPVTVLVVDEPGAYLGKRSERLQVRVNGTIVREAPLLDLRQVLVAAKGASISTEAIRACCESGIAISFLSRSGAPYARLESPALLGTVRTRREQLLAYGDQRGVTFARASIAAKLLNQQNLLRYMAKYRKESDRALYLAVSDAATEIGVLADTVAELDIASIDEGRSRVMNLEAQGGKRYWDAIKQLLLTVPDWSGRAHQGASDPVNACLNYGYGILYGQVESALALAGLDPYAGFVHADRAGKPSMVFDLIEEFRQPVADRAVFALLNRGEPVRMEEGRLDDRARRLLAERVLDRLATPEPYRKRRHTLRAIIALQAQRLAAFFRGEGEYTGFVMRW